MDNIFNSLVRIQSQGYQYNWIEPFKPLQEANGIGTGFFINNQGYILTCAHVIDNSLKLWVSVPSNGLDKYEAEIISFYPELDMAIIKIIDYNKKINFLKIGNSDKIIPGEDVMAVGYPLGQDKLKITKGIISGRESGLIQTDTPLNPGNSGGPLLNNKNEVLGINSSAYKSEDAENVGFAIPINFYNNICNEMVKGNKKLIFQPSIGCTFYNSSEEIINFYDCQKKCNSGVIIKDIFENSDLKKKIKKGDILCKINNYDIDNYSECRVPWNIEKVPIVSVIERFKVGENITMEFWSHSENKIIKCNVKVKSSKDMYPLREKYPLLENIEWEIFGGVVMVELTLNHIINIPSLLEYIKPEKRNKKKVLITQIYPGSSLSKSLILLPGNVIKNINNIEIHNIEDVRKAINKPLINKSIKYIKIENEENKTAILSMEQSLKENLFLSQNYNFPITKLNESILKKEYIKEISKQKSIKKKTIKSKKTIKNKQKSKN